MTLAPPRHLTRKIQFISLIKDNSNHEVIMVIIVCSAILPIIGCALLSQVKVVDEIEEIRRFIPLLAEVRRQADLFKKAA
jgi:hypothetical protein